MGRDIGAGLTSTIKKMNAKGIDQLITKLEAFRDRIPCDDRVRDHDAAEEDERHVVGIGRIIAGIDDEALGVGAADGSGSG